MDQKKEYNCEWCANAATPYCEKCNSITSPSGKKSKPTNYVARAAKLIIVGGRKTNLERIETNIRYCLDNRYPIPVKFVELYNKITEKNDD